MTNLMNSNFWYDTAFASIYSTFCIYKIMLVYRTIYLNAISSFSMCGMLSKFFSMLIHYLLMLTAFILLPFICLRRNLLQYYHYYYQKSYACIYEREFMCRKAFYIPNSYHVINFSFFGCYFCI